MQTARASRVLARVSPAPGLVGAYGLAELLQRQLQPVLQGADLLLDGLFLSCACYHLYVLFLWDGLVLSKARKRRGQLSHALSREWRFPCFSWVFAVFHTFRKL